MSEWKHSRANDGDEAGSVAGLFQPLDQLAGLPASLVVCAVDGTILSITHRALDVLNVDRQRTLGANIQELYNVPLSDVSTQPITTTIEMGAPPDARHVELECQLSHLPGIPGPSITLTAQDVTRQIATAAERDRLMRIAVVSEILPAALHEIRNPLAATRTMVELLVEESTNSHVQNDLYAILREVRRIQATLNGIGTVGHTLLSSKMVAVDYAIEETVRTLTPTAKEQKMALIACVSPMPLLPIDPTVLRGIVFNLVRNAIDACNAGSTIEVVAAFDNGLFELTVADDGPGMSPEVVRRASDLFFSTKDHGSGIGLALVRRSVENIEGTFTIESEPGAGTNVYLSIPVPPPPSNNRSRNVTHRKPQ